jgi:hypothetical protein
MKNPSRNIIPLLLWFAALSAGASVKKVSVGDENSYFPVNNGVTLVYQSTFGESLTTYTQNGEFTISSNIAKNFKYRQTMIIKDDGVYVKETYQFIKVLLLFKKETTYTYGNPLLRFPLPLSPGTAWTWEGDEYAGGKTNKVKVTGNVLAKEWIATKAGRFEAIKLESFIESSSKEKNRVTEWYAEGIGLIKAKIVIEGGGAMGTLRDIMGYGTIEFELKEIRKQ